MQSKVHPTYKTQYRVANWPTYNQALVRRGDVTVWVSSEAIAAWTARRSGRRGGPRRYSDLAIETALTCGSSPISRCARPQGSCTRLFGIMRSRPLRSRLDDALSAPSAAGPARESLHLVLDSTGLSLVGAGEWAAATTRWLRPGVAGGSSTVASNQSG